MNFVCLQVEVMSLVSSMGMALDRAAWKKIVACSEVSRRKYVGFLSIY